MTKKKEMKTMTIKNKLGRIVTVEYNHWVRLISKEGAELVIETPKKEAKKTEDK